MKTKYLILVLILFLKSYIFSQTVIRESVSFINANYKNKIYFPGGKDTSSLQKLCFYYSFVSMRYINKFYDMDTVYNIYFVFNNDTSKTSYYLKYSDFSVMVYQSIPNINKKNINNEIYRPGILILIPSQVKEFNNKTFIKLLDYAINNIYKLRYKAEELYYSKKHWDEDITYFSKATVVKIINSDLSSPKNNYIEKIFKRIPPEKYLKHYYEKDYMNAFPPKDTIPLY